MPTSCAGIKGNILLNSNAHQVTVENLGKMITESKDFMNNGYFIVTSIVLKCHKGFNIYHENLKKYLQSLKPLLLLDSYGSLHC